MYGIASLTAGIIVVLFATDAIGAEIHRCTDAGKTTYSDRPCEGKRVAMTISYPPASVIEAPIEPVARTKVAAHGASVGMKARQVTDLLGAPAQISQTKRNADLVENWTYCRDNVKTEMEIRNGVVTKIEDSVSVADAGMIPVTPLSRHDAKNQSASP